MRLNRLTAVEKTPENRIGLAVFIPIPCQGWLHPADPHLPAAKSRPENGEMLIPIPAVLCKALSTQWDSERSCCPSTPKEKHHHSDPAATRGCSCSPALDVLPSPPTHCVITKPITDQQNKAPQKPTLSARSLCLSN